MRVQVVEAIRKLEVRKKNQQQQLRLRKVGTARLAQATPTNDVAVMLTRSCNRVPAGSDVDIGSSSDGAMAAVQGGPEPAKDTIASSALHENTALEELDEDALLALATQ